MGVVFDSVATVASEDDITYQDSISTHEEYKVLARDTFEGNPNSYSPPMLVNDNIQQDIQGSDYDVAAYIDNQPPYMSAYWIIRISDDSYATYIDDSVFRKVTADALNDDGTIITSGSQPTQSPLNILNIPTNATNLPVGAVYSDGGTLKIKT